MRDRVTAPFTIFYRNASGEGGYVCETCREHRHDKFARMSDAFAAGTQHLNLCRGAVARRPVEGTAIIDGAKFAAVLRGGVMIVALETVFEAYGAAVRAVV